MNPDFDLGDLSRHSDQLLWSWHARAFTEVVQAFKVNDFPKMHKAYAAMSLLRNELDERLPSFTISCKGITESSTGERSARGRLAVVPTP